MVHGKLLRVYVTASLGPIEPDPASQPVAGPRVQAQSFWFTFEAATPRLKDSLYQTVEAGGHGKLDVRKSWLPLVFPETPDELQLFEVASKQNDFDFS
jgi:hypothetical protein